MGYVGQAPAAAGVTSADILDGTVATADIADDAVTLAKLSATGTASSSTYLRGDNSWAAAGGVTGAEAIAAVEAEATLALGGQVMAAAQPYFAAHLNATDSNVTGDNTIVTIKLDTESLDVGGNFDTATYTFTAPVDGRYLFACSIGIDDVAGGYTERRLICTSRNFLWNYEVINYQYYGVQSTSVIVDMDANDTAYMTGRCSGSNRYADITAGHGATHLTGYLLPS